MNRTMNKPPLPDNEEDRLKELNSLGLLDTESEERFDRYTRLAVRVFQVPFSMVTLVDSDRQWFKSRQGISISESPRDVSFCAHAILEDEILVVSDTRKDPRFLDNPMVTVESGVRFYAGCPIRSRKGFAIGTLCIAGPEPMELSEPDRQILKDLARMLQEEINQHTLATVDELTGLSNRRGFLGIAGHAIAMCKRMNRPATLMFFDLDGFKEVNDKFGHAEGDKVLVDVGQLLLSEFRYSDVIARLGGDEFCVLLTGTDANQVARPLENLNLAVQLENDRNPYVIGYSVGTVMFDVDKHNSISALVAEADRLMYEQKRSKK
jgi:diguanylate cyclase (GGDEF)-like protein